MSYKGSRRKGSRRADSQARRRSADEAPSLPLTGPAPRRDEEFYLPSEFDPWRPAQPQEPAPEPPPPPPYAMPSDPYDTSPPHPRPPEIPSYEPRPVAGYEPEPEQRRPATGGYEFEPGTDEPGLSFFDDDPPPRADAAKRKKREKRRRRGGRFASFVAVLVVIGVLGVVGYGGYRVLRTYIAPPDYAGRGTGEIEIRIKEGQSAADVSKTLHRRGVIASERAFINAITAAGTGGNLHPGTYRLRLKMSAAAAVKLLDPELRIRFTVTIREGLRANEVYAALAEESERDEKDFTSVKASALGLPKYADGRPEGYLFPATYDIPPKAEPKAMLKAMVDRFKDMADGTDMEKRAKKVDLDPGEVVVVASLVQAEAGRVEDMPKIARVIYNRLRDKKKTNQRLELDSTVMYALKKKGTVASEKEVKIDHPFNTYRNKGLPPGAICNPGEAAIKAALNPAKGDWLYFIAPDPKDPATRFTDDQDVFWKWKEELNRNMKNG